MQPLLLLLLLASQYASGLPISSANAYQYGSCPAFIVSVTSPVLFSDIGNPCRFNQQCLVNCLQLAPNIAQQGHNTYIETDITTTPTLFGSQMCRVDNTFLANTAVGVEGDTFTGSSCYATGAIDPTVNAFCYLCTRKSRNVLCSTHGIQPVAKAWNDPSGVCICDNGYYGGYIFQYAQCSKNIRADLCNGHGSAPTTDTKYASTADPVCVCDLGWSGQYCNVKTHCPCGGGGDCTTGSRICTCRPGFGLSTNQKSCCPLLGGKVCNGHPSACATDGQCVCPAGFRAGFDCRPTAESCAASDNCPACLDPTRTEVLGVVNVNTGRCDCYANIAQPTDSNTALLPYNCMSKCPHMYPATSTMAQCGTYGTCKTYQTKPADTSCTCTLYDVGLIGTSSLRVYLPDTAPGLSPYGLIPPGGVVGGTGLCCPAWPGTGFPDDIGQPAKYKICGGRGTCRGTTTRVIQRDIATTEILVEEDILTTITAPWCDWVAGRADPYGCPVDPGQFKVCNGQTCRQDGVCDCNTGTTNLKGATCLINVACDPSASLECSSGGTCTQYPSSQSAIQDLGFLKRPTTFLSTTFAHGGIPALVRRLYTTFGLYNQTDSRLSKVSTYTPFETACTGMTQDECLHQVILTFSALDVIDKARRSVGNNATYTARVLLLLHPDITQPPAAWQNAVRNGLGSAPNSSPRNVAISNALAYKRYYDWNSNTAPAYATVYSSTTVKCNCTAPAAGAVVGFGGLQCQGSCQVGPNGQVCSGFTDGIMNGYCNAADGTCKCAIHRLGGRCGNIITACINTTIMPYTICNGRADARCLLQSGTTWACVCPIGWKGAFCDLTACPVPASASYAQLQIECSGYGICGGVTAGCACDVSGQLALLDPLATSSNKPRLPYGPACEFNGIDDCGTFVVTGLGGTGKWSSCNGHGTCVRNGGNTAGVCVCNDGFAGAKCQTQQCVHGGGCNARQNCNPTTGLCECRTMWTNLAHNCTTSLCGHGIPSALGTSCLCEAFWAPDPVTGRCTVPSCPPTYWNPLTGTERCTGNEPLCASSAAYAAGGCCRAVCTNCVYNVNASADPFCVCGNSLLQNRTNGICRERCGGGVASLINGALECNCDRVTALLGTNQYISDPLTCSGVKTCLNGGTASGQSCVCTAGTTGSLCEFRPCGLPGSGFRDASGTCKCNWPFIDTGVTNQAYFGGQVEGIGAWVPPDSPCGFSACFSQNYYPTTLSTGSMIKDTRTPTVQQIYAASGIINDALILGMQNSGYSCRCGDDESCANPLATDLFVPEFYNGSVAKFNAVPCAGPCNKIATTLGSLGAIFDVTTNAADEPATFISAAYFRVKHISAPSLALNLDVFSVRNHTVYTNCSTFPHRTGQWCYDLLCENGGVAVLGPLLANGSCSCEFGTVYDYNLARSIQTLATDKLHCMPPATVGGWSGATRAPYVPVYNYASMTLPWVSEPACGTGNQHCSCPFAYTGTYCQTLRCNPVNATVAPLGASCICKHGWSGPYCTVAPPPGFVEQPPSSSSSSTAAAAGSSSSTAGSSSSSSTGFKDAGVGVPTTASATAAVAVVGTIAVVGAVAGAVAATGAVTIGGAAAAAVATGTAAAGAAAGASAAAAAATAAGTSVAITVPVAAAGSGASAASAAGLGVLV